jgi:cytochrome c
MRGMRCAGPLALAIVAAVVLLGGCTPSEPPPEHRVPGGDPERGRLAIQKYGCEYCHRIPGVEGVQEIVAPPLDAWAERRYIAGKLPNEADNLILWIVDPHAVEPGTAMPNLGVSESEARDIAAYLYTLGEAAFPAPVDSFPDVEID